jgi:site-specific recombinase XerD
MKLGEYFEPFVEYSVSIGCAAVTIREYRRMLQGPLQALKDTEFSSLRMVDINQAVAGGEKFGKYGAQKAALTVRRMLQYIRDTGSAIPVDYRDVKVKKVPRKRPRYLTEDEIDKLRKGINLKLDTGLRTRAMLELMLTTGMRIGEVLSVTLSDIDWHKNEISFINCKNGKEQTVDLLDTARHWLKKYLATRTDKLPNLFVAGKGKNARRLGDNYSRIMLKRRLRKIGINTHVHWHIFRKTYGTMLLLRKVDIKSVQVLMRHEDPRTTMNHYIAVEESRARAVGRRALADL